MDNKLTYPKEMNEQSLLAIIWTAMECNYKYIRDNKQSVWGDKVLEVKRISVSPLIKTFLVKTSLGFVHVTVNGKMIVATRNNYKLSSYQFFTVLKLLWNSVP